MASENIPADCFYINGSCPPGGAKVMTKPVLRSVSGKDFVFAVADGSRTKENVPTPAHTLCSKIKNYHEKLTSANIEQLDAVMRDFATDLNGEISVISSASSYSDYASSLCVLTVNQGVATVTNLGNTSAFLLRDGQLTKLTAMSGSYSMIGKFPSGVSVVPEMSDSYEITKNDTSYTIETVNYLLNKYSVSKISMCVGSDMLYYFEKWKCADELMKKCALYSKARENDEYSKLCHHANYLEKSYGAEVHIMNGSVIEVSSTKLRNSKDSEFLDTKVSEYIKKHGLYS